MHLVKYHRFCSHVTIGKYFWNEDDLLFNTGNSKIEIRIRLATAVSALVKLEKIWRSGEIEFKFKFRLLTH